MEQHGFCIGGWDGMKGQKPGRPSSFKLALCLGEEMYKTFPSHFFSSLQTNMMWSNYRQTLELKLQGMEKIISKTEQSVST
jgi:hypothetical protein